MCGIAGFLAAPGALALEDSRHIATRMADRIRHRGPDDGGPGCDPAAGVAIVAPPPLHHRPVARRGPAHGVGRRPLGHRPSTARSTTSRTPRADLEAVGAGVSGALGHRGPAGGGERLGPRFERSTALDGMFAFALWDRQDAPALPGARPGGGEAALLMAPCRWRAGVWVRAEGACAQFPGFAPPSTRDALAAVPPTRLRACALDASTRACASSARHVS